MADEPNPPQPTPIVAGGTIGTTITAASGLLEKARTLTPMNVVIIGCLISMVVISGLHVWQTWLTHENTKLDRVERHERYALDMRANDMREELVRRHCAAETKEFRDAQTAMIKELNRAVGEERKERLKFEADERAKDRAIVQANIDQFIKWRALLEPIFKKLNFEDGEPVLAPMPRLKVIGE